MPRRPWSEDDVAKLRSMAGRLPAKEIAAELGRTPQATMVEASKLKISLSTRPDKARAAVFRTVIRPDVNCWINRWTMKN
jgi:hypothetical protein